MAVARVALRPGAAFEVVRLRAQVERTVERAAAAVNSSAGIVLPGREALKNLSQAAAGAWALQPPPGP